MAGPRRDANFSCGAARWRQEPAVGKKQINDHTGSLMPKQSRNRPAALLRSRWPALRGIPR